MDPYLVREEKGNNPEIVRESQRRRFANVDLVDELIDLDKDWRKRQFQVENLRKELNKVNKQVSEIKKLRGDATELIQQAAKIKQDINEKDAEARKVHEAFTVLLQTIGNLVNDSVPISNNEADNVEIRARGETRGLYFSPGGKKIRNHAELVVNLGIVDLTRGPKIAGTRGFFLEEEGSELCRALVSFGLKFLKTRGFKEKRPPHFMTKPAMAKCAQLEQFDEELYKVTGGEGEEVKYLIATAEQPLVAYHMDEWIQPSELPKRYSGYSHCFRKEAGSHGKETGGIFRVHEFEKVEQFCMTGPNGDDSWEMFEEMINNSQEFYHALGIPYRVMSIVSGALNNAAAKKYDLEGWFPASQCYRELVSCSNCTDYQARKLEIRYGHKKGDEKTKQYVHTLNSTLCAVERTICCILENYQREDGVEIPEVLQPYMDGMTFLPFKKPY